MRNDWIQFSFSVCASAASSVFVTLLLLILVVNAGSAVAMWAVLGELDEDLLIAAICAMGFFHIVFACIQLWGFLQLMALVVISHRLLFDEAPRFWPLYLLFTLQFITGVLVSGAMEEWTFHDGGAWLRSGVILAGLLGLPGLVLWRRRPRHRRAIG